MTTPAPGGDPTSPEALLSELRASTAEVATIAAELGPDGRARRAAAGEWTVQETLTHLAASEPPFRRRLDRILEEDHPFLPWFGPDVARPDTALPADAVTCFVAAREDLVAFLVALTPEGWARPAVHETMGPTTLALQIRNILDHDHEHLEELRRCR